MGAAFDASQKSSHTEGAKKIVCGVEQANRITFEQYVRLALSHARFSLNEDTSWTVEVPVLPGCISWGMTRREAVEMAKDAIEAWIITALRFGDEIPAIDGCYLQYAKEDTNFHPRGEGHTAWNFEGDSSRGGNFSTGMGKALRNSLKSTVYNNTPHVYHCTSRHEHNYTPS